MAAQEFDDIAAKESVCGERRRVEKMRPVAVDDSAKQRREALAVLTVYRKFLLQENHDDVAVATSHGQVHGGIAEFIRDVVTGADVEKMTNKRRRAADDGKQDRVVATAGAFVDLSTI